jgi:tetratricopeptide (TPR) repeat protein/predicted Ser/Thr protein kinase
MAGEETDDEGDANEVLPRPAPDDLARRVAKARIAGKLFASTERVNIGRYHLLEMVGSGGMGVVWGAWDPELERRVAIKLMKAITASTRERILAEGQALAKLSHPNVVAVFDVGVVDEQVYLVMEWVRGKNLRAWCASETRTVRDVVAVYRAAGEGLRAAHEAGLVHRDFKPDNAVVGDDGRVRVLDFGLARSEHVVDAGDDTATRGAGTPRYMPPEQVAGGELTAAADQYAFGTSLDEAVKTSGDVPTWVALIVKRATAKAPTDRFASMADLLDALGRDPRTVWRRRLAIAAVLGLAGGAFAAGTMRGDGVEPCSGARAEIAAAWDDAKHVRLVARLQTLGAYGESVARQIAPELDAYAARWASASRTACRAARSGELAAARYEQHRGCLARTRAGLSAVHEVLSRADNARLADAVLAARSLPDPDRCRLEAESSTVPPPSMMLAPRVAELSNEVARARVLALALDPSAVVAAEDVSVSASRLGYGPLEGRAVLTHGIALLGIGELASAAEVLGRAHAISFAAGDTATGVEAFARQVFAITIGETTREGVSASTAGIVENVARGLGPTGAFERALLLNNLGTLRMSSGDRAGARAYFESALRVRPRVTGATYELASIPGNLALVETGQRRADLFAQQQAELVEAVGEQHPLTLTVRASASVFSPNRAATRQELRAVRARVQSLHPHLKEQFGWLSYDELWLAFDDGDMASAHEASAFLADDDVGRLGRAYLLLADDPGSAVASGRALVASLLALDEPPQRWRAMDAELVIALGERRLGNVEQARRAIDRALELSKRVAPMDITSLYQYRIDRLRALRAQ